MMSLLNQERIKITLVSLGLLIIGLVIPDLLEQWRRNIVSIMEESVWQDDKGKLIQAAAQVVAYNGTIMFPYVTGALIMAYGLTVKGFSTLIKYVLPLSLLALFHYLAFKELDYRLPLGSIALVTAFSAIMAWRTGWVKTGILPLILIPGLIVLGFNSLSIAPFLATYGLAGGDFTWQIILAGRFLNGEDLLNFTGLTFCLFLLLLAVGATELIALYQRQLKNAEELSRFELQYQQTQIQVRELRVIQEMHTLVHDLKTPLMTVQGLNSLLQMAMVEEHLKDYTRRIEGAVDNLNKMISEILYDDVRKTVAVEDLIQYIRAHVLVKPEGQKINFSLADNLPLLEINLIRLARALINLIENAVTAVSRTPNGKIEVEVTTDHFRQVIFTVRDNGVGIPADMLDNIWASGFSTKSIASGLGLGFVKSVVENHRGTIEIDSRPGSGTTITIRIPGVQNND